MNRSMFAALMVLLAVLALFPNRRRGLHRLAAAPRRRPSSGAVQLAASVRRRLAVVAGAAAVGLAVSLAVSLSLGPQVVVSCVAVGAIALVVLGQRRAATRRSLADARRTQLIEACDLLAADLTAGRPPHEALEGAAGTCPELQAAATAARLGGDVPAVLELAAESPGFESLKALAAAWRVADESGAALAATIERLAGSNAS